MTPPAILDAITPVVEALEQLEVAYHIGGSVASSASGIARTTLDVDVVADLHPEHVQPLAEKLQDWHASAERAFQDLIIDPATRPVIHTHRTFGEVLDILGADGRGMRFAINDYVGAAGEYHLGDLIMFLEP